MSSMTTRSIRDATRALQTHFSGPKVPLSLPSDARRVLQSFVDEHEGLVEREDAARLHHELKLFWDRHVNGSTQKLGSFVGVLRELRPAILDEDDLLEWYHLAAKPVISAVCSKKTALEDAQEFLSSIMVYDENERNTAQRERTSTRVCNDLLGIYIARTHGLTQDDQFVAPDNAQIAKQIEAVLVAFGRKMPKQMFLLVDDLILRESTRLQGLTLLSSFLQHQTPHLYLIVRTPLIEDILRCLMNDTSTTVLSVALTTFVMLMPHIPSSLAMHLPRLFLIYSRLLCWEKFSPLSTQAQKNLVTDDRVSADDRDHGDVGIDLSWEKARPREGMIEPVTPELMTYFTYVYGLYPLHLMSYIRKPRKFLKNFDFPGADDFDLDQAVIRQRSEQFRSSHLLHPNFYNMTLDEELSDPKWPKMDPADVVAECQGLVAASRSTITSPGPPPTSKLPPIPPIPPSVTGSLSPSHSQTSLRSGHSWRDTQSTAVSAASMDQDSPVLGPTPTEEKLEFISRPKTAPNGGLARPSPSVDEFPLPSSGFPGASPTKDKREPLNNLEYLQKKLLALQNDLNFERWHKAQYSQHMSQLTRKNAKDATIEAETLNLINANRALKQQLEQVRQAREATVKDANLTRKQSNNLEANMSERFNKMKKEQETWAADADELKKLRSEMKNYRELLSTAEARELNKTHQLDMLKGDLEQLKKLQTQLQEAQRKVREYEFREFDYEHAKRELEIVVSEKETLQLRVQRQEQERERTRRVYADKMAELEAQLGVSGSPFLERSSTSLSTIDNHATQQALADAQSKLTQLKKAHSRLLEKHTDLELEYQTVKNQLDALQGLHSSGYADSEYPSRNGSVPSNLMSGGLGQRGGILESVYGLESEYEAAAPSDEGFTSISTSDPLPRRNTDTLRKLTTNPMLKQRSEVSMDSRVGLTWNKPPQTGSSSGSGGGGSGHKKRDSNPAWHGYNATAPLGADERSLTSGESSGKKEKEKEKILANSEVRVYGRGGAQNIKMKNKEKEKEKDKSEKPKNGGFKALKGIAGL